MPARGFACHCPPNGASGTLPSVAKGCTLAWGIAPSIHILDVAPDRSGFIVHLGRRTSRALAFAPLGHLLSHLVGAKLLGLMNRTNIVAIDLHLQLQSVNLVLQLDSLHQSQ